MAMKPTCILQSSTKHQSQHFCNCCSQSKMYLHCETHTINHRCRQLICKQSREEQS